MVRRTHGGAQCHSDRALSFWWILAGRHRDSHLLAIPLQFHSHGLTEILLRTSAEIINARNCLAVDCKHLIARADPGLLGRCTADDLRDLDLVLYRRRPTRHVSDGEHHTRGDEVHTAARGQNDGAHALGLSGEGTGLCRIFLAEHLNECPKRDCIERVDDSATFDPDESRWKPKTEFLNRNSGPASGNKVP